MSQTVLQDRNIETETRLDVELRKVFKVYDGETAVRGIDLTVRQGEFFSILGPSGCGKTTTLRLVAGFEEPTGGEVLIRGKSMLNVPSYRRPVNTVFQSYALFGHLTVWENIAFGLRLKKCGRAEVQERVGDALRLVKMESFARRYPAQLSGGQQQRVAIARALAYEPEVLLFDEPFGALDAQIRVRLRREIRALLKKIKVPSIFITHDQEEALELGDRIAVLNNGSIEQIGTPFEVYNYPQTEYVATFLGAANLLLGIINGKCFETGDIFLKISEDDHFRDGQSVKLVFRPEDVFLRKPENLTRDYQRLTDGTVEEVNFVGAFERVVVRLNLANRQPIIVTRPKTETNEYPLKIGQKVIAGLVNFRILPNFSLASERSSRILDAN